MAPSRYYSSVARQTTLTADASAGATTLTVAAATGWPSLYPYTLILDEGTVDEEVIEVTNRSGTTLTVTRGVDGTTGVAHTAGASVKHGVSARDFSESRDHEDSSAAVHGLTGTVVGTTDTQVLSNKTLGSNLAAGGYKITGLADPASAQDAVTKNWAETQGTSFVSSASASAASALASAAAASVSAAAAAVSEAAAAASAASASAAVSASAVLKSTLDAKGDLIVASAADTPGALTAGADGTVLTASAAAPLGVVWSAGGSGTAGFAEILFLGGM
jgi:hypothetical protein